MVTRIDYFFEKILILITVVFVVVQIFFKNGQLSPDSIHYLSQAESFWTYKINFPLGYAFFIKLISFFTGSYLFASKIINIISYLTVVFHSYKTKFFFSETVTLFSFYPLVLFYSYTWTEPLFYLIIYFIIHTFYKIIREGIKQNHFWQLPLLFFLLVSVRFSGVFIVLACEILLLWLVFKGKTNLKSGFSLILMSGFGAVLYLGVNFLYSGFILGDRTGMDAQHENFITFLGNTIHSFMEDFSVLNMILHKGLSSKIIFLNPYISVILVGVFIYLLIKKKGFQNTWYLFLVFAAITSLAGIIYSYYFYNIDDTVRVKSGFFFFINFLFLLLIPKKGLQLLQILAIIILGINCYSYLKYSPSIVPKYQYFVKIIEEKKCEEILIEFDEASIETFVIPSVMLFDAISLDHQKKPKHIKRTSNNGDCEVESILIMK